MIGDALLELLAALGRFDLRAALDVAVVAVGLYAAVAWLRRSQAALVAVGFALVCGLYLVARALGLELTLWALQGFFAALALVVVILFQEELRQAFEELAAWALGRRSDHRPRLGAGEILGDALGRMAQQRVGALVVIPGIQKPDRHFSGGVELSGALSTPLLASLFDPHSAGHDGAVVLEDRTVVRFGVQLPLSRRTDRLAGVGTRHSAALGLSERCDALCLVVSEERGTVSAALDGRLEPVPTADDLDALLKRFYRKRRALAAPRPLWQRLWEERQTEVWASLAAAFVLWLLVASAPSGPPAEGSARELPPVAAPTAAAGKR